MKVLVQVFLFLIVVLEIGSISEAKSESINFSLMEREMPIFEHSITGPDELCLYYGSIIGEFFGGGRLTDVFRWRIINENGQVIIDREGGFQTFSHTFSEVGEYEIQLNVRRGVEEVFSGTKKITINPGANITLNNAYLLCDNGSTTMQLLDPNTPGLSNYRIEWTNSNGTVVSTSNTFTTDRPDRYTVSFFTFNQSGAQVCPFSVSTTVSRPRDYSINISANEVCQGGSTITLSATNNAFGNWFFTKDGGTEETLLGEGRRLDFTVNRDLNGPGDYEFIFRPDNSNNEFCKLEEKIGFRVNFTPNVRIFFQQEAESCEANDGILIIEALGDVDRITLFKNGQMIDRFFDLKEGEVIELTGMEAAIYRASVALGNCSTSRSVLLPMSNPPDEINFNIIEITDESCNETGTIDGKIKIQLSQPNFTGSYRLLQINGTVFSSGEINNANEFEFFAPAGSYFLALSNDQNCSYPNDQRINISSKGEVNFSVPDRLNICEYFDFSPTTSMDLVFTLIYPDNTEIIKSSQETFRLDQAGEYRIIGRDVNTEDGFCPRELNFFVNLTNQINYEPELISEDCFGNKQYFANLFGADISRYNIRWINENGVVVGTEEFLFPTSSGEFKLEVQPRNSEACPTPPKSFFIQPAVTEVAVNLSAEPLCPGGESRIDLVTDFDEVKQIFWLFIDEDGESTPLDQFDDQQWIVISEEGSYEAVVYNRLNCEIGRNFIQINTSTDLAIFDIPESIVVCEFYELTPQTELDLTFIVRFPDGNELNYAKGDLIFFDQEGEHLITASSADPTIFLCEISKAIQVTQKNAIPFSPELVDQSCDGTLTYSAELFGTSSSETDFLWYGPDGSLLGEMEFFQPQENGIYELEVRPQGSLVCPEPNRISFEVIMPVTELDGSLSVAFYCPNAPFTTVTLDADLEQVTRIQWYFTNLQGDRTTLDDFFGQSEIIAIEEGFYRVETFNALDCPLGADEVLVQRSTDDLRPQINENYTICAQFGLFVTINPGSFSEYQWFFNGELVSESSTFEPRSAGSYDLIVTSVEGCDFSASFEVVEECKLQIRHTTGMQPNNDKLPFEIYANFLIDEIEVWIYNHWGQLVYHCLNQNNDGETPSCSWMGVLNGEKILQGTYAVKIRYKNNFENIDRTEFGSLIVIDGGT
ncbi:gliding motility-associated C-terminal domain-containing protein [Mongoliitalea daihaiensis]|uniref:gliding motility-associated C-terminal domain-containing protein n=1 Tax=Mongoliitalea daihaiensis TaxID=2782006 RepID=UPI001F25B8B9|nr:gliding motility-associated C-terminal domain-containing protein [Mongoliitalea daihaiensis]UJP64323.1 gliding motility-associated C-terminal domain-containing protein [Mongoliitalea daihaiensis]